METVQLTDNLFWLGVKDPDLRVFDVIMQTEFGTTYNAYLLRGSERSVLVETVKEPFFDEYIAAIEKHVPLDTIDTLIVNHTEPDHAGSIQKLLQRNPNITIVGTTAAMGFLKEIVHIPFQSRAIRAGDTLSLGGDQVLSFHPFPNLHWPDTMFTHLMPHNILFTCDAFGAHYSPPDSPLRSAVTNEEGYLRAAKYYFDNILGPFRQPFMQKGLQFARDTAPRMICTGHGPVLDSHIKELFDLYTTWCTVAKNEKKRVVIAYASAYGYTASLAMEIARALKEGDAIDVSMYDMVTADPAKVQEDIASADGFLLGSATILSDALSPIWHLVSDMLPITHGGKYAGAFGSYGWTGEAVPNLLARFAQLRLKVVGEGYRVRFRPTAAELEGAYQYGVSFKEALL